MDFQEDAVQFLKYPRRGRSQSVFQLSSPSVLPGASLTTQPCAPQIWTVPTIPCTVGTFPVGLSIHIISSYAFVMCHSSRKRCNSDAWLFPFSFLKLKVHLKAWERHPKLLSEKKDFWISDKREVLWTCCLSRLHAEEGMGLPPQKVGLTRQLGKDGGEFRNTSAVGSLLKGWLVKIWIDVFIDSIVKRSGLAYCKHFHSAPVYRGNGQRTGD